MNYVYSAVGCIIVVFILLILKKKKKVKADYLLIAINLLLGSYLLSDVLVNWKLTSATVVFQNGIPMLLFPVFVFYILQYTHAKKARSNYWYLVFLPFLLFFSVSITDHFILKNYETEQQIVNHFNAPSFLYQLIFKGFQILIISTLIYLIYVLKKFKLELKTEYSLIENIDIKWLENFTWIYLGSSMLTLSLFIGQNIGVLPFQVNTVYGIIYGVLTIAIFYMNYQGIQHYTLSQLDTKKDGNKERTENINEVEESMLNGIEEQSIELRNEELKIEQAILNQIEREQLYLNPKLSLDDLATQTNKNKHLVSKIINAREGRSFYDLINVYRVEHLKKLLDDPKNNSFTILYLALESGFNSKASLNRIFKKISGITPKQYMVQSAKPVNQN